MTIHPEAGFESNRLFRGVAADVLGRLVKVPEIITVSADEVIFEEGDPGEHLFLILEGSVRISKRGRGQRQETLAYLTAGDFFGDMVAYDLAPRSARATAVEEVRLGSIARSGLEELFRLSPIEIHRNLAHGLIERLRHMDDHLIRELLRTERLSAIGSVAATIAHDFRQPINTITLAAGLLEEEGTDPALVSLCPRIRRAVRLMTGMTEELIDFSKGRVSLELAPIAVADLLQDLEELLRGQVPSSIRVEKEIAYEGELGVDRGKFGRALLNLLKNAVEAMQSGGTLRIGVAAEDGSVVFTISDTGSGIPASFLPRLFEPFETQGKAAGTGLGMAIVKSVVEAHEGTISVSSAEGEGTTFVITVPRTPRIQPA